MPKKRATFPKHDYYSPTYLETSQTLSQILAENEDPKPKRRSIKMKPFIPCGSNCPEFTGVNDKWNCRVGISRCVNK